MKKACYIHEMRWFTLLLAGPVWLGAQPPPDQAFADVFAAVLLGENPDGGNWSGAGKYLAAAERRAAPLQPAIDRTLQLPMDQYRLLIVPGFLSACASAPFASAPAFNEAQQHLRAQHGVDVALLPVPNDSCENNGKLIAKYLREHAKGKKYIVVGHSKGAADLQLALQDPAAKASVAALISVAGAVRGSPLADLPEGLDVIGNLELSLGCVGKLGPALQSLRRDVRLEFLASHPNPSVPSYSVVAVSGVKNTSQALLASWWLLVVGFHREDGMLAAADGTLPGAKFLGTAFADHVAVAHDFQKTAFSKLFNKGNYPRTALLEALVRFVIADLDASSNLKVERPDGRGDFWSGR